MRAVNPTRYPIHLTPCERRACSVAPSCTVHAEPALAWHKQILVLSNRPACMCSRRQDGAGDRADHRGAAEREGCRGRAAAGAGGAGPHGAVPKEARGGRGCVCPHACACICALHKHCHSLPGPCMSMHIPRLLPCLSPSAQGCQSAKAVVRPWRSCSEKPAPLGVAGPVQAGAQSQQLPGDR